MLKGLVSQLASERLFVRSGRDEAVGAEADDCLKNFLLQQLAFRCHAKPLLLGLVHGEQSMAAIESPVLWFLQEIPQDVVVAESFS